MLFVYLFLLYHAAIINHESCLVSAPMDTEKKSSGDLSQDEAADDVQQPEQKQPSTPPKVVVEEQEDQQQQQKHLSPNKSQESSTFLKPRSPLGFFKHRMGNKKRRESGGQSEAESESGSSTISNIEAEERRKSSGDFSGNQLTSSLDSPQQPPLPKPRRGIAKVFHDLRYRSRVTKSHSAPATSMENNSSVASAEASVDDVSNSSYATPLEAHSSGYSTPMLSSESMVTSPETSIMGESLDEVASAIDHEKTVQNSPGADVLSSAGETPRAGGGTETRTNDETPQRPPTTGRAPLLPDTNNTGGGAPSSVTRPLSHHRASVPGSTKELQERPSSANEIRFCFSEHRGHLQSPIGPNNNGIGGKTSPGRGLIRSLPADPADMDANNSASNSGYPKNEHLYKVLVIGELGTGKTSIIKRYVHQFFSQHYRATIGVDFALKVVHWDQSTVIRLQLWDIAGQERFGNMTRVYYKEAVGAFIVFDVTRNSTFESVAKWKLDLDSKVQLPDGSPIPCVLLANKCDQPKEGIAAHKAKMDEYCAEKGFAGWFETSAKDNINIDDAAKFLVGRILENDQWSNSIKEEDADRLDLHKGRPTGDSSGNIEKKKGCC